ncbi:MAG: hypothetical protein PHO02_06270 [Candidatus Nanoarchaeia archaeon]|nr:hypothetical protein [Candidatus Nanoarchaeia archaeon]
MKKALALAGLVTSLYAENAISQEIPARVDDGRPYLTSIQEPNESDWYLTFPLIPYIYVSDCTILRDAYPLASGLLDLDAPEGNILENRDMFEAFANEINELPRVNSSIAIENLVQFGLFTEYVNFHGSVGGWGRADLISRGLDEYAIEFNLEEESVWANFGKPQTAFFGRAYADIIAGGNFVIPSEIFGIKLYPSIGVWYRHREFASAYLASDALIYSGENVYYPGSSEVRSYGDGLFFNAGIIADFSAIEEYTRPVAAVSIDNFFSYTHYADNPLNLPAYDPARLNLGIGLSPMGWFDIRAEMLNIGEGAEYRFEIAKRLDWGEFAAFVRIDERTLLGHYRDSFNIMAAFGNDYAQLRIYTSVDDNFDFGLGIQLGVGWRISEFF